VDIALAGSRLKSGSPSLGLRQSGGAVARGTFLKTGPGGCPWCGVWWLGDEVGEVHDERKPMLRVVRLPEGTVEPAPVSLDTGYALDDCLRRDGWIEDRERLRGCSRPVEDVPFVVELRDGGPGMTVRR
jgi:hypothetical protein